MVIIVNLNSWRVFLYPSKFLTHRQKIMNKYRIKWRRETPKVEIINGSCTKKKTLTKKKEDSMKPISVCRHAWR